MADDRTRTPSVSTTAPLKDATRAFFGEINNHSGAAKEKMRCLRVARLAKDKDASVAEK